MMNDQRKLQILATASRLLVIFIQYLANIIIPDHNAHVFVHPEANVNNTITDRVVTHILGGFVRWDSQYFMHIAKYGYTYENTLAFFPLYPISVKFISLILHSVFSVVSLNSILLLVFVGFNIVIFVLTVKLLFNITTIFFNDKIAFKSSVLFCFNPASIFFTAPYTECLFSYLTFFSVLNCVILYKKYSNLSYKAQYSDIKYITPIMLSIIVRSNGLLNVGFLLYVSICLYCKHSAYYKDYASKTRFLIKYVIIISTLIIITLLPFIMFQVYCYSMFCKDFQPKLPSTVVTYAEVNNFILPGHFSKYNQRWCYNKIPLAYSYVQDHYWNVGFLKYYTLKQIPNFLLASPILFIVIKFCLEQIKHNSISNIMALFSFNLLFKKVKMGNLFYGPQLNVFVIHALFISIFCILFIHIQVATRMICSSTPLFYWACASYFHNTPFNKIDDVINMKGTFAQCLIKIYFLSYFVIGTVLFSNFLPWT